MIHGKRTYDKPLVVKGECNLPSLVKIASNLEGYARLFYELGSQATGTFDVVIRSINSKDARTASVTNLPLDLVHKIVTQILKRPETKNVYWDVTPKPPGTIEYV